MSLRARRYGDIDPSDEVHDEIRELAAKTRTAIVARQNMDTANVLGNLKMFGPSEGSREVLMREKHAAEMAMQSGIYVVYRNFSTGKDCARVGPAHRCFCTHTLADHSSPAGRGTGRRCTYCVCNMFQYIPNRPEEIGEGWLARRSNFSSSTWFAKCRCGHGHNEHLPNLSSYSSCRSCRCSSFDSAFLCVVCDKHWEEHGTVFETEDERRAAGRSVGSDFLPLADVDPEFSEIVFGDHTRPQRDSRGNQSITLLAHSANGGLKNIRLRIKEPIGKPGQKAQNCSKCGNKWAQGIQCPRCGHRHG